MLAEYDTASYHEQSQQFLSLLQSQGQNVPLRIEAGLNHLSIELALADPNSPAWLCLSELVAS